MNIWKKSTNRQRGVFYVLLGSVLWGFAGTCAQYLFDNKGVDPSFLTAVRLMVAGVVMIGISSVRQGAKTFVILKSWKNVLRLAIFGFVGVALCQYTYFLAIAESNAGTACVLQYLAPVFIIAWVCIKQRKWPAKLYIIAMLVAILGVFFVATGGNIRELQLSGAATFWGISAAFTVAVYTIMPGPLLKDHGPQITVGWGMIFGAVLLSPFLDWWDKVPVIDFGVVIMTATVVILGTIITFTVYLEGVRLIGSTEAGLYSCIEPVTATACSAIFLGTRFNGWDLLGFLLVMLVPFIIEYRAYLELTKRNRKSRQIADDQQSEEEPLAKDDSLQTYTEVKTARQDEHHETLEVDARSDVHAEMQTQSV